MWSDSGFQILCLAEQIQFTVDVENAIRHQTLHQLEQELTAKQENYTSVNTSTDDSTGTQTPGRMCVVQTHNRFRNMYYLHSRHNKQYHDILFQVEI